MSRRFLNRLDGPFKTHLDRYKYASRFDPDEALAHRRSGAATLAGFEQQLTGQPALSGAHLGLLDFASLPFVRQFRIADPDWFDAQPRPHLHRWLADFLQLASLCRDHAEIQPLAGGCAGRQLSVQSLSLTSARAVAML